MKSKYSSINEQSQKQNEDKLVAEIEIMHRRGKVGDYVEICPVCNRANSMIVVLNKKIGIANCSRCKIGVKVNF